MINGLIRNIEASSDADVAYDTALESAVTGGFGYFRINLAYADDDSFNKDICIRRVANPFSVYGDPYSTAADSADWNTAFVVDTMPRAVFEKRYKGADTVDWTATGYAGLRAPWADGDQIMVAEYWTREADQRAIVALSSGEVVGLETYEANKDRFDALNLSVIGNPRLVKSHKVKQRILTGAEVLETVDWAGKFIPIVPVYGEDINVEGQRHLRSMVRDAKDPQQMFNYWRTAATELVALAPKAPWIGPRGAFKSDAAKWASANTQSHAHIEYDGPVPPQRQEFAGVPAGALQEALNASDDMKAIMGLFDASLGAPSNETSGRAILMRQREGDVSSFHFIDNLSRAIRHAGRIIIDLIPHVYSTERMVRVLGADGSPQAVPVNQKVIARPGQAPLALPAQAPGAVLDPRLAAMVKVFDLTVGKYDVTVETGPSFTTQREAAASQMMDLIRAYPAAAPMIGDLLVKNLDWPGADEIAQRLQAVMPGQPGGQGAVNPLMAQAIALLKQQLAQVSGQLAALQNDRSIDQVKTAIDAYQAETGRLKVIADSQIKAGAGT